jgi:hypothetical protein
MAIRKEILDELLKDYIWTRSQNHQEPEPVPERRGGLQAALPCLEKHREKMDDADQGMEAGAATIRDRVRRRNAVTLNYQRAIYTKNLRPSCAPDFELSRRMVSCGIAGSNSAREWRQISGAAARRLSTNTFRALRRNNC